MKTRRKNINAGVSILGNGKNRVVIVGNGAAGYYAAETLVSHGDECEITLIAEEKYLSYFRPRLSHFLGEKELGKNFFLKEEEWYASSGIRLMLDTKVTGIDTASKNIKTDSDETIEYDRLILSHGGSSFLPPTEGADLKGVFTLKTLDDAYAIKEWMGDCQKALVIGGGLLGIEAAWGMKQTGLDVTINNTSDRLLSNQLCLESGLFLENVVRHKGVDVVLQDRVTRLVGEGRVESVEFESGMTMEADIVLFSVGIRPNLGIAREAGIECNRGIVVDRMMRTNAEGVFACGDVAELEGRGFGNWIYAMQMGKVAAMNALGGQVEFKDSVSSVVMNSFGTSVNCIGQTLSEAGTENIVMHDDSGEKFKKLIFKDGKLIGGILIGDSSSYPKLIEAVSQEADISEFKKK